MFTRAGQPTSLSCDILCAGGVPEGTVLLSVLSASFQSLPPLPTSKLGPSGADSWVGGWVCVCSRTLWVSAMNSPGRLGVSPEEFPPQPPQVFSVRGLRLHFPAGTQLFLLVYVHMDMGLPALPAAALQKVHWAWLPISAPPTGLAECFFFNSLVVRLP